MTKPATLTRPASEAEAGQARRALEAMRQGKPLVGDATVPPCATAAFEGVLEVMAEGGGVAVAPLDAELTTHQAADILGVSRPNLTTS